MKMYMPTTGRFNKLDPFLGDFKNPQSLHKYAYVHGDPINGTDPTGLLTLSSTLGGISVSSILGMGAAGYALTGLYVANQLGYIETPLSETGIAEGFVPFWGSGNNFLYHVNNGQYLSAVADAGFFVTDFFAVKGIAKLGYRAFLYSWKQAAKPGVFWAVWGLPQQAFRQRASNHFMWQVGDYVYDATRNTKGVMTVTRELATDSRSYAVWKLRLPIPLPAIFRDAANTCGASGGNCFTQLVTAMEAAGVPEAVQTIIKGVYLYENNNP